jgi:ElaB/YqjD/DUF883 family membrane-anchored ribosome-binding protein
MPKNSPSVQKVKSEGRARWSKLTDEDFDAIKTNVVELATRLQARYAIGAEEAMTQAEEFMQAVEGVASDAYGEAVKALDNVAERLDRAVKENAWATVGGALLLGGVIGYLLAADQRRSYW